MPGKDVSRRAPRLLVFTLAITLLVLLSSCSYFNETRLENSLGKDVDLIDFAYDIADDLIADAFPPLLPRNPEMAILTTTFVDHNDLEKTSHFGRLLQDHIGTRFVQSGYTVREIRLRDELHVEERAGETILSRRLALLDPEQSAQAILTGTVSMSQRTMYISARLVNPHDASIVSARNYRLYMDQNVLAMYKLRPQGDSDEIPDPGEPLMNRILY